MLRTFKGTITSVKQIKTVSVKVVSQNAHPLYKKLIKTSKKFQVDCGDKKYNVGDVVTIIETRHLSKNKNFKIMEEKK